MAVPDKKTTAERLKDTRRLAESAMLLALTYLPLLLSVLLPSASLSLRFLASCMVVVACLRLGTGRGALVYLGATLLGFLLHPFLSIVPFALFFGLYPLLSFSLARWLKASWRALVLRSAIGAGLALATFAIYDHFLQTSALMARFQNLGRPVIYTLFFFLAWIVVLIYDYLLQAFVHQYYVRFR